MKPNNKKRSKLWSICYQHEVIILNSEVSDFGYKYLPFWYGVTIIKIGGMGMHVVEPSLIYR